METCKTQESNSTHCSTSKSIEEHEESMRYKYKNISFNNTLLQLHYKLLINVIVKRWVFIAVLKADKD